MKNHNGMRPHDIVVLLKITTYKEKPWLMRDIAIDLGISAGEISESLNRSKLAGLLDSTKKRVMKLSLKEFIKHGLKYVYPQQPGAIVRGLPTAYNAPPLNELIKGREVFVWPWSKGNMRGQGIQPLYKTVPEICAKDKDLYALLALVDAIRIGRAREQEIAMAELEKKL
ncbi:MAG: hypothetical protein GXO88_05585 [Chlorobi bacterium]|nr:hypothetical protein [Chlorobiota bacterium]